jgi:hypothetical protein
VSSPKLRFPRRSRGARSRVAEQACRGPGCRANTVRAHCNRIQDRRRGRRHRGRSVSVDATRFRRQRKSPFSTGNSEEDFGMTAARLVLASAPVPARDAPPGRRRPGSPATAPTFDRSPRRPRTTRDDTLWFAVQRCPKRYRTASTACAVLLTDGFVSASRLTSGSMASLAAILLAILSVLKDRARLLWGVDLKRSHRTAALGATSLFGHG